MSITNGQQEMWTWAPEGNAGAATRTATKLWNDPEYNNLRSGLASARKSLCRGLGSRWFTERFHRNALVTHFQHGQVFCTARQLKDYAVTRCRLHQRASQRSRPQGLWQLADEVPEKRLPRRGRAQRFREGSVARLRPAAG